MSSTGNDVMSCGKSRSISPFSIKRHLDFSQTLQTCNVEVRSANGEKHVVETTKEERRNVHGRCSSGVDIGSYPFVSHNRKADLTDRRDPIDKISATVLNVCKQPKHLLPSTVNRITVSNHEHPEDHDCQSVSVLHPLSLIIRSVSADFTTSGVHNFSTEESETPEEFGCSVVSSTECLSRVLLRDECHVFECQVDESHRGGGREGEGHLGEGRMVEDHVGEGHMGESHVGEGQVGEGHMVKGHVGEGHMGESQVGEGHIGEGQVGEGHRGEGQVGEGLRCLVPTRRRKEIQEESVRGPTERLIPPDSFYTGVSEKTAQGVAGVHPSIVTDDVIAKEKKKSADNHTGKNRSTCI